MPTCQHCNQRESVATVRQTIDGFAEDWRVCQSCIELGAVSEFASVEFDSTEDIDAPNPVIVRTALTRFGLPGWEIREYKDGTFVSACEYAPTISPGFTGREAFTEALDWAREQRALELTYNA